jgi:transposase
MIKLKGWEMYQKIQRLKKDGLNKSQIAKRLNMDPKTIRKYIDMTPDDYLAYCDSLKSRSKKLDQHRDRIEGMIRQYPEMMASQIADRLHEILKEEVVTEGTVRNYVNNLRLELGIPRRAPDNRDYEAMEDPPMGRQMQVDFGEMKLQDQLGKLIKIYIVCFVLSHSRFKYAQLQSRPFNTRDLLEAHEKAFEYFGGRTEQIVYDQDSIILASENGGDLVYTYEFTKYKKMRKFDVYMCRKSDPETKGRVESMVKYVKNNCLRHREYTTDDEMNQVILAWLERRGNGKEHGRTKKVPAEVFALEKQHLIPVDKKINNTLPTNSIERTVRKNNTICYLANEYSLPPGTYDEKNKSKKVTIEVINDERFQIIDTATGAFITDHELCHDRGRLIKKTTHTRDRNVGIPDLKEKIHQLMGGNPKAYQFIEAIHKSKGRYIRDQLKILQKSVENRSHKLIFLALDYCMNHRLYSANDFSDALAYYHGALLPTAEVPRDELMHEHLVRSFSYPSAPEIRDFDVYNKIMRGVRE